MIDKEDIEKMFGWAMEDTAEAAFKEYIENKNTYYTSGYAFGKLSAIGNILGLSFERINEIERQQQFLVRLGQ